MSLKVEVGADVTKLQTGMAVAKAELKDVSSEVKKFASEMVDASEAAQAKLLPSLEAAVAKEAALKAEIAETNVKLKEHAAAAEESGGVLVRMTESVEGLNVKISETKGIFTGLGELFLAGLGAEKIIEVSHEVIELGDSLHKASEETGISVQTLSALKVSADEADLKFDQLQRGVAKFSVNLQQAEAGTGKAAQIFGVLGITQDELKEKGNNAAEMMELVAQKLDQYGNGANKEAIVTELFGARLRDIAPVLKDLAENGIQGLTDKAREQGVLFDGDFAESMKKAHDQGVALDEAIVHLTASMAPMIKAVAEATEWWAKLFAGTSRDEISAKVTEIKLHIDELQDKLSHESGLDHYFDTFSLDKATKELKAYEQLLADMPEPQKDAPAQEEEQKPQAPVLPNLGAQRQAIAEAKREKQEAYQEAIAEDQAEAAQYSATSDQRIAILGKELATAKEYWGEGSKQYLQIQREMTAAERQQTDQRIRDGEQAIEAQDQAFNKGKDTELQGFIQHEQEMVSLKRVSADDAAAQEVRLTEEIYAQELKRLDVAITLAEDDLALHRKLTDQKIALAQKESDQIQKITNKAADEEARKAIQTDQEIARSGAQTGAQLIFGKETVAQAAEQYAEMAVEKVIEWGFKELLAHVGFEAKKVVATEAGEQAQVVAKIAGAEEGKAVDAAAGSASVMGDAYKAAAGAYAAVAGIPYIGPILAPIAAGVAFAAVGAFDIFSAEGGIDRVPYDGAPFLLHENETVLSSGPADLLRTLVERGSNDNGGGDTHNHFDFTGANFGGRSQSEIEDMVVGAFRKAVRKGALA